jgi:flavin reductase (DIM6/NTAB) family NADH-FMN oxidoreductase RutF
MEIWTPRDNPFQGPYQSQDPAELGQAAMYRLMTGAIQPRPIALITTLGPQGPNLAPFSFFTGVASHPPTLAFSIAWKKPLSQESSLPGEGEPKDTLRNLDYCDEFVVHFSSEWLLSAIQKCSIEFPWGVNEIEEAGLKPMPSTVVRPPRIEESPIHLECRVTNKILVGAQAVGGAVLVLGEIVKVHVRQELWKDWRDQESVTNLVAPLSRLGGNLYAPIRETWQIPRKP